MKKLKGIPYEKWEHLTFGNGSLYRTTIDDFSIDVTKWGKGVKRTIFRKDKKKRRREKKIL